MLLWDCFLFLAEEFVKITAVREQTLSLSVSHRMLFMLRFSAIVRVELKLTARSRLRGFDIWHLVLRCCHYHIFKALFIFFVLTRLNLLLFFRGCLTCLVHKGILLFGFLYGFKARISHIFHFGQVSVLRFFNARLLFYEAGVLLRLKLVLVKAVDQAADSVATVHDQTASEQS